LLNGRDITNHRPYEVNRLGLARSFQITNLFHRLSAFENLRCSVLWSLGHRYAFWKNLNKLSDAEERAENILERVGLRRRRDIAAGLLTYAEQRALEIGITIAGGASVILLDEPTAGMSRAESRRAVELIRDVTQDSTLLMVEHDMSVVFDLADRISVLVYGQLIASGPPADIRANNAVREAYLGQAEAT
jgi:branched-chain amino acid transport system ATP-binding protein